MRVKESALHTQISAVRRELATRLAREAMLIVVAGMDTTTLIVTQATRFLARHPEWLQALWEEQERLIAEFGPDIDRRVRHPCSQGQNWRKHDTCSSIQYMMTPMYLSVQYVSISTHVASACAQVVSRSAVALAVVQEALRLEPAVRTLFRIALEDTTVGDLAVPKDLSLIHI